MGTRLLQSSLKQGFKDKGLVEGDCRPPRPFENSPNVAAVGGYGIVGQWHWLQMLQETRPTSGRWRLHQPP